MLHFSCTFSISDARRPEALRTSSPIGSQNGKLACRGAPGAPGPANFLLPVNTLYPLCGSGRRDSFYRQSCENLMCTPQISNGIQNRSGLVSKVIVLCGVVTSATQLNCQLKPVGWMAETRIGFSKTRLLLCQRKLPYLRLSVALV